jgi:hypothetical protein
LLQKFKAELDKDIMAECAVCKERWFDIKLRDGVCTSCTNKDKVRRPEEPFFFSATNDLDFGNVPAELPELTQIEEQLIARVHVHIEVFLYRGRQYKYRGHIVHFLRNVGRVYDQLPRLPQELDIVLLHPANFHQQPQMVRQFQRTFYIRQSRVRTWLTYLKANHPLYRDIIVREDRLNQLPEGEHITNRLAVEEVDAVDIKEIVDEANDESDLVDEATVPNLVAEDASLDQLRAQIASQQRERHPEQPQFEAQPPVGTGGVRSTPLNEFNHSQALLSLAFPTLYPRGEAEFISPRIRSIGYYNYIRHAIQYRDGRFARHSRFRFVAFNT